MYALLIYSLKVSLCVAVFYLFFKFALSKETFHRLNRVLILGMSFVAYLLPLWVLKNTVEIPLFGASIPLSIEEATTILPPQDTIPWEMILGMIYLMGVVAMLGWVLYSVFAILRLIYRSERCTLPDGVKLVLTTEKIAPFSWGNVVVMTREDWEISGETILIHERAHLKFHHSVDLMLTDLAGCLQWYNPAMWLLRRELRAVHEYEADAEVIREGVNARDYQLLLIKKAVGGRWYSVANSFNHSKLKNRITMMYQKKSSRWAVAKTLLLLPLVGIGVSAFAETVYIPTEDKGMNFQSNFDNIAQNSDREDRVDHKDRCAVTLRVIHQGESLVGAVVRVMGEKKAAVTDLNGEAKLDAAQGAELLVEYEGFPCQKVAVPHEAMSRLTVEMTVDEQVVKTKEETLILIDGRESTPEMLHNLDSKTIASVDVLKSPAELERLGTLAKGKKMAMVIKLKSAEGKPQDWSDTLILIDGQESTPEMVSKLDSKMIGSVVMVKYPAELERLGAAAKGKSQAMVITLKKDKEKSQGMDQRKGRVVSITRKSENATSDATCEQGEKSLKIIPSKQGFNSKNVLYVINGEIKNYKFGVVSDSIIGNLSPNRIESVTVVKDPEQMKQWGEAAEGKDGVMLINLKK